MVTKILGRREESLLTNTWSQMMPRGRLTKVDVEAKIYKMFRELDQEQGEKGLAYKYLHKVLDVLEEYSN